MYLQKMWSVYSLMVQNLLLVFILGFLPNLMKVSLILMHFPLRVPCLFLLNSFIKISQNKGWCYRHWNVFGHEGCVLPSVFCKLVEHFKTCQLEIEIVGKHNSSTISDSTKLESSKKKEKYNDIRTYICITEANWCSDLCNLIETNIFDIFIFSW